MDDDDIQRRLAQRGDRGDPVGADGLWRAARAQANAVAPRRPSLVSAAAAAAVVALLAATVAIATNDDGPDENAAPPTTTTSQPSLVIAQNASSLVLFDDCTAVLDDLKAEALKRVGPYGLEGSSYYFGFETVRARFNSPDTIIDDGTQSGTYGTKAVGSPTNTQEEGIDEPDLVETDGERLYDVRGGTLRVIDIASAKLTATIPLALVNVDGAVLVDDVLVVFANEPTSSPRRGEAKVVLVDVAGAPVVGDRLTIDGTLVDVRVVDGRVHLVTVSWPSIAFTYATSDGDGGEDASTEANKERIRSSTLAEWLPSRRVTEADGTVVSERGQLTDCSQIRRPKTFGGFEQTSLVTLDLDDLAASESTSVQAASMLVYGSAGSLYTATTAYVDAEVRADDTGRLAYEPLTDIHRFALSGTPTYAGSGRVAGYLRDQFGMSEHEGHLRVASTDYSDTGTTDSRVTVLRVADGELVQTGVVTGLGPNEDIEGVRFVGDLGYVVTFRRTDPLYVVDLRDPRLPRLAGKLEIPGYSEYLHPVGDGLVLGVGVDGTPSGQILGAAVSLFDVSDPAAPKRVDIEAFGPGTDSAITGDHHAFRWVAETHTAYVPVGIYAGHRVQVLDVGGGTLTLVGTVNPVGDGAPTKTEFDRTVIAGHRLLSVSPDGVQVSELGSLKPLAWVSYR